MRNSWEMQLTLKKTKNHEWHILHGCRLWTLFKLYIQQYKESISQDDKLIKVFASCFVSSCSRPLVDDDFPVSSQHMDGAGRSGCHQQLLIAACQQRLRMPTRTQHAGRAAAAALTAPSDASDDWDEEWNFHVHRWRGLPLRILTGYQRAQVLN